MKAYQNIKLTILFSLIGMIGIAQEEIRWIDFQAAVQATQISPKKIYIDFYTDWCGWCKKMDASTFTDSTIIDYMNKNYYCVKFNAESHDTYTYQGKTYTYKPESRANELAVFLLNGKLQYPTTVFLNERANLIQPLPGYQTPEILIIILKYFATDAFTRISWEDYQKKESK